MTALPQHAARAAQETRERVIAEARKAYMVSVTEARNAMAPSAELLTLEHIPFCRSALYDCLDNLLDIEARLPGSARQGQVRDVAEGDPAYLEEQGR